MHAIFIPYGKRELVERFIRDMEAQKHLFKMTKDGQTQSIYLQGVVRQLPFGFYEYIFPKEDLDIVLTSLDFDKPAYPYYFTMSKLKWNSIKMTLALNLARAILHCKKAPKFNKEKTFLWTKENVSIIPIGIREDGELIDQMPGPIFGWTHEAI